MALKVKERLAGCTEPRLYTPPLRELTPETSLGFGAIKFANNVLKVKLYPWQEWLLIHALELNPDGNFRFRVVIVLVARQNGKSLLTQVLALFFMFVLGVATVVGTAQDLDIAEDIWEGAVDFVESTPSLDRHKNKVVRVNGKKALTLKAIPGLTKGGTRYKVKAANRSAGRGLTGDLILLDELREHKNWEAWAAVTKTTMARDNAQIWAASNAGDVASVVLRSLRRSAHEALGDPDQLLDEPDVNEVPPDVEVEELEDDTLGIFEWSARPGCGIWDREAWAQANPSLGYGISERAIKSAASSDPEWVFRTEVLCQWSEGTLDSVFPPGSWEACTDEDSEIPQDQEVYACVDVSWNRGTAYVAVAGRRAKDGKVHVEVAAARAGTDWVVPWLVDPERPKWKKIVVQAAGAPASSLLHALQTAFDAEGYPLPVHPWQGADIGRAHGEFYDLVVQGEVRHRTQPTLDQAATTAVTRPIGDGAWAFDRKRSPRDVAPLVAAVGACWLTEPLPGEGLAPQAFSWPAELMEQMAAW